MGSKKAKCKNCERLTRERDAIKVEFDDWRDKVFTREWRITYECPQVVSGIMQLKTSRYEVATEWSKFGLPGQRIEICRSGKMWEPWESPAVRKHREAKRRGKR